MLSQVTLKIPNNLFMRAKQLTQGQSKQSTTELVAVLDQILASAEDDVAGIEEANDLTEQDPVLAHEMQAYITLHPMLKKTHLGKHVAIYQGRLVDIDDDYDTLTR